MYDLEIPAEKLVETAFGRNTGAEAALVFVHGFTGDTASSWAQFDVLLKNDPRLSRWDIHHFEYKTEKRPAWFGWWQDDPSLAKISKQFLTYLSLPPLSKYKSLAFVVHSMGGLIAQRALLDSKSLGTRTSHLILFGVPSAGSDKAKAKLITSAKQQIADMSSEGLFITELRSDWIKAYPSGPHFTMRAVAGDMDAFIPETSTLDPFPLEVQRVISGDHTSLVKATKPEDQSITLVVETLLGVAGAPSVVDSARLAVEHCCFQAAVDALLPNARGLDDAALCSLALALDGLGRGREALSVLDDYHQKGTTTPYQARGILAGRLKRRWLLHRLLPDLARSKELYTEGLVGAEAAGDTEQAYYMAINVAFLEAMALPANSRRPVIVDEMVRRALNHCANSPRNHWRLATEGEAELLSGSLNMAVASYKDAVAAAGSPRDLISMYTQAVLAAEKCHGSKGCEALQAVFGAKISVTG